MKNKTHKASHICTDYMAWHRTTGLLSLKRWSSCVQNSLSSMWNGIEFTTRTVTDYHEPKCISWHYGCEFISAS